MSGVQLQTKTDLFISAKFPKILAKFDKCLAEMLRAKWQQHSQFANILHMYLYCSLVLYSMHLYDSNAKMSSPWHAAVAEQVKQGVFNLSLITVLLLYHM